MTSSFVDSGFPILVYSCPITFDAGAVREMAAGFERYFARGERYALLIDVRNTEGLPDAVARKSIVDWSNRPDVKQQTAAYCISAAMLLESALARRALTAIMWAWKAPMPMTFHTSLDDALDASFAALERDGQAPPRPVALRDAVLRGMSRPIAR